jgi:uncharacterized protein (TIGR02598 family)
MKAGPAGFSLVEVTLAMGVAAFALLAVVGLLPAGMKSAQDSNEQARATEILNLAATAVQGEYYLGATGSPAVANYSFANYFSDQDPLAVAGDTAPPWSKHTKYFVGQANYTINFNVLEDLSIRRSSDVTSPRYQLYMSVTPPPDNVSPVKAYLSVAWPGVASYGATGWIKQQGSVETTIYANLPAPR